MESGATVIGALPDTMQLSILRRVLIFVFIFVMRGSCITVVVAWICALTIDLSGSSRESISRPTSGWSIAIEYRPGAMDVTSYIYQPDPQGYDHEDDGVSIPSWGRAAEFTNGSESREPKEIHEAARGWPMLALWCELDPRWYPGMPFRLTGSGLQIPPPHSGSFAPRDYAYEAFEYDHDRHALPLRPIWSGFLVNVTVYGILCLLIGAMVRCAHPLMLPLVDLGYRLRRWLLLGYLSLLTAWILWILGPFFSYIPGLTG